MHVWYTYTNNSERKEVMLEIFRGSGDVVGRRPTFC